MKTTPIEKCIGLNTSEIQQKILMLTLALKMRKQQQKQQTVYYRWCMLNILPLE